MAKKKNVEEELSPQQKLADREASEFLGEEVVNGKTVEETPAEEPVVETPEETPAIEEELDQAKFVEEIAAKVSEKITPPKVKEPTPTVEEDLAPWEKEGRNPRDYNELAEWSAHLLEVKQEKAATEREAQTAAQTKAQQEQEAQQKAGYNAYIDEQLEELFQANKLPRENLKERENLFKTMYEVNQKRVAEGKAPILSVKEIYYEHYKPLTTQPAGADAPISGGAPGSSPNASDDDYSYQEIHRSGFVDLYGK